MERIRDFIKWTLYITTGVLIVCAINVMLIGAESIPANMLWQILLSGMITSFVTVVLMPRGSEKKSRALWQFALHYVALCAVMIVCGSWFGWMNLNMAGILMMLISVAVVYLISFVAFYITDMRQAEAINEKLKEKYGEN